MHYVFSHFCKLQLIKKGSVQGESQEEPSLNVVSPKQKTQDLICVRAVGLTAVSSAGLCVQVTNSY